MSSRCSLLADPVLLSHNGIRIPLVATVADEEDGVSIEANVGMIAASRFDEDDDWAIATTEQVRRPDGDEDVPARYASWAHSLDDLRTTGHFTWTIAQRVGVIDIRDEYQPNFSVSRDIVSSWKWDVLSCIHLAFVRALIRADDELASLLLSLGGSLFGEFGMGRFEEYSMRAIQADPLYSAEDGWKAERFVPVFSRPPTCDSRNTSLQPPASVMMSHQELVENIRNGDQRLFVRCPSLDALWGLAHSSRSFPRLLVPALLQPDVRLRLDPDVLQLPHQMGGDAMITYEIVGLVEESPADGLSYYPPVSFVEYLDEKALRIGRAGLNIGHPLSRWLIAATPELNTRKRGVLTTLWQELTKKITELQGGRLAESVRNVNRLLDALRNEGLAVAPPDDLVLSVNDYVFGDRAG
jgi:hypothetical protein